MIPRKCYRCQAEVELEHVMLVSKFAKEWFCDLCHPCFHEVIGAMDRCLNEGRNAGRQSSGVVIPWKME